MTNNNNNFKSGVEATRKNISMVKAEEVAKDIKQYGGIDVYNLMKSGKMYAIVIDGVIVGGAVSEESAKAGAEYLTHFTGGKALNKETLMTAMNNCYHASQKAYNLVDAEKVGIKINSTFVLNNKEYIVDDTNELYTIDGEHICNITDIMQAKDSGCLTDELFNEIVLSRVKKYDAQKVEENDYDDEYEDDYDDEYEDDYDDEYDDDDLD